MGRVAKSIAVILIERFAKMQKDAAGIVVPFAGAAAPAGWLLCSGAAVSRTQYAQLFAVIGTTYGSGDGKTTFNLPDLRGRVPVGVNGSADPLGKREGEKMHALVENEMPRHSHRLGQVYHYAGDGKGDRIMNEKYTAPKDSSAAYMSTDPVGWGEAHNNMQPSLYLNYIIKA